MMHSGKFADPFTVPTDSFTHSHSIWVAPEFVILRPMAAQSLPRYLFATAAGLCGAILFGIVGTWLVLRVVLFWKIHETHGQGGVEFASLNAAWILPLALVGFAVAFYSTLRKLKSNAPKRIAR